LINIIHSSIAQTIIYNEAKCNTHFWFHYISEIHIPSFLMWSILHQNRVPLRYSTKLSTKLIWKLQWKPYRSRKGYIEYRYIIYLYIYAAYYTISPLLHKDREYCDCGVITITVKRVNIPSNERLWPAITMANGETSVKGLRTKIAIRTYIFYKCTP